MIVVAEVVEKTPLLVSYSASWAFVEDFELGIVVPIINEFYKK